MGKVYNFIEGVDILRVLPKDGSTLTVKQLATRLDVSYRTVINKCEPLLESKLVELVLINKKQFGYRRCNT